MYVLVAKCSFCGREGAYTMSEKERQTYLLYQRYGRKMGFIQDLFP